MPKRDLMLPVEILMLPIDMSLPKEGVVFLLFPTFTSLLCSWKGTRLRSLSPPDYFGVSHSGADFIFLQVWGGRLCLFVTFIFPTRPSLHERSPLVDEYDNCAFS